MCLPNKVFVLNCEVSLRNGEYILVVAPDDYPGKRYRDKYCYEHHLVWWENTGCIINDGEIIHHLDENKTHNVFSNLELHTRSSHAQLHCIDSSFYKGAAETVDLTCFECGSLFILQKSVFKTRIKSAGHSNLCCSRSCQVTKQQRERY